MRTTLDIDDDLLTAAREIARRDRRSIGKVVSRLMRQSLTGELASAVVRPRRRKAVAGFVPFPARSGVVVTDEEVNALRDIEGI